MLCTLREDEMRTMLFRRILAAFLLVTVASASAQSATHAGWKTYRSADFGFQIDYPRTMSFYPGGPEAPPEHSMIPVCDQDAVACFEYNGHALDHTIIQGLGVSINVLREMNTKADCYAIDAETIKTAVVHGRIFHYVETSDAAAGSSEDVKDYRTFYRQVCFEVALHRAQSDVAPIQYAEYGIRPLNKRALRALESAMYRMLLSFVLVGPVKNGAGWSTFTECDCGETFEYPWNASVERVDTSSTHLFNAWGISCLERFMYGQSQYLVAAKEGLPDRDAVTAWLESTGFPPLNEMQWTAKDPSLMEYRGRDIVYFLHGSSFFVITETDGSAGPTLTGVDGVLDHLASSFRVQ